MPDIDIDLRDDFEPTRIFPTAIPASMVKKQQLVRHNCGVYFQSIPVDPVTGIAAIPYEEAEVLDYFKIDFLHLSLLDNFESKDEIRRLIDVEPNWDLLLDEEHYPTLFQISKQYLLISQVVPRSVPQLADCIALIRPSKKHLINQYVRSTASGRVAMRDELYRKPHGDQQWFKKGHAIAYALTIVLQLHIIERKKNKYFTI